MSPAKKATPARSGASSKATKSSKQAPVKKRAAATAARKKAPKKTAARKVPAKKAPTAKSTGAKKSVAKKAVAKKPVGKKPVAKKKAIGKKPVAKTAKTVAGKASVARSTKPSIKKPITRPAPPAPPKRKVRPAKFDKDQLAKIRAGLETKRIELAERQRELEEASFDSTQSDITGEVGLDEDFADAGTATFERERDLSIRNNIRDLIDQVTQAMERIDEGTYGTCARCGQPIDATRLRELPHASLCLDCKRREERAR
jgi:RNA polymerase-binding protein DksA